MESKFAWGTYMMKYVAFAFECPFVWLKKLILCSFHLLYVAFEEQYCGLTGHILPSPVDHLFDPLFFSLFVKESSLQSFFFFPL